MTSPSPVHVSLDSSANALHYRAALPDHCSNSPPSQPAIDADELERRGFTVVRRFCNVEEVAALTRRYTELEILPSNNYAVKKAVYPQYLLERIETLLPSGTHNAKLDAFQPELIYATGHKEATLKFPWHIDHGSYYLLSTHEHYVRFYLVVEKEVAELSNLCLVPRDKLAAADPAVAKQLRNAGAHHFVTDDHGQWILCDDYLGRYETLSFDLEEVACTPHLEAGDLLLFYMDTIHRTQDNTTRRLAFAGGLYNSAHRSMLRANGCVARWSHVFYPSFPRLFFMFRESGLRPFAFLRRCAAEAQHMFFDYAEANQLLFACHLRSRYILTFTSSLCAFFVLQTQLVLIIPTLCINLIVSIKRGHERRFVGDFMHSVRVLLTK